jgi:hypothetical protein
MPASRGVQPAYRGESTGTGWNSRSSRDQSVAYALRRPAYSYLLFERCAACLITTGCARDRVQRADVHRQHLYSRSGRHSSAVEQLFRKQQVLGSNPSVGSTPPFRAHEEQLSGVRRVFAAAERARGPANSCRPANWTSVELKRGELPFSRVDLREETGQESPWRTAVFDTAGPRRALRERHPCRRNGRRPNAHAGAHPSIHPDRHRKRNRFAIRRPRLS